MANTKSAPEAMLLKSRADHLRTPESKTIGTRLFTASATSVASQKQPIHRQFVDHRLVT